MDELEFPDCKEGGNAEEQLVCVSKGADAARRAGDKQMPSNAAEGNEPFVLFGSSAAGRMQPADLSRL